ncbi:hypothetical protein JCM10207_003847 [Rhodosporidiobolus poonsookiae]
MTSQDLTGSHSTRFFTKTWTPPAGVPVQAQLLFVHGFIEHIERYDHAFPRFAQAGIAVFAYDQRGFGRTATYTPKHSQGVTSWPHQLADLAFWLAHAKSLHPDVPLFLFGHSMGGGLSLAFPTRTPAHPLVADLAGVVVSSPLIRQAREVRAHPLIVRAGSLVGKLSGGLRLKAEVKAEDCTRDAAAAAAYMSDPLCKQQGTFRGVADMLLGGEQLLAKDYKNWPKELPLLIVHGDADRVTCHHSSSAFVDKLHDEVGVRDASFHPFEGYYHEMHNEPGEDKYLELDYIVRWLVSHVPSASPSSPGISPGRVSVGTAHTAVDLAEQTAAGKVVAGEAPVTEVELGAAAAAGGEGRESKL